MQQPEIPVIAGPTASGKTAVAVHLAQIIGGELISADSMQVYKHLSIGTAKPTTEELQGIPCHLIDHISPDDQYHLGRFVEEATACISQIQARHKVSIISGGTGLYIRGLLYGIFDGGEPNHQVRAALEDRMAQSGLPSLFEELQSVDPASAALYGPNDPQRIVRALEVYHATGKPLSSFHSQDADSPRIPSRLYVLSWPREVLYDRINKRVDNMVKNGLMDEVQTYLRMNYSRDNPAIKALGYRELINVIEGELDLKSATDIMKKKSRNYAKRQETWFRSMKSATWIDCSKFDQCAIAGMIAQNREKSVT